MRNISSRARPNNGASALKFRAMLSIPETRSRYCGAKLTECGKCITVLKYPEFALIER